jgi:hypothetical protein
MVSRHDRCRDRKWVILWYDDSVSWHDTEWLSIVFATRRCCKCHRPDGTSVNVCVRDVCPFIPFTTALGGYPILLIACLSPFGLDSNRRQQNYLTHLVLRKRLSLSRRPDDFCHLSPLFCKDVLFPVNNGKTFIYKYCKVS